ncbi:conserved protein of unknown function (plasmid) [Rhodovastum atsumiense]|uniref:Uncharacterized protein n=1 Tax=Rhodovastum atsumiense TaxID=504468 RepID=A0A5M6IU66_9PROT|nr:hypothetical protein [Rhodovastum atsumiense]KAA5611860.1 hypothetical protein F1189_12565 [Rhodovastum atsumiense]CAH2606162.1 conserved protein of unknown function [Rhodovastum atsumiense]
MKIVDFKTFCSLPDGTVFQELTLGSTCLGPLSVRHRAHGGQYPSFDYQQVGASVFAREAFGDAPQPPGESEFAAVHPDWVGDWGYYDYTRSYLIYEPEDIRRMLCLLRGTDDGCKDRFDAIAVPDAAIWPEKGRAA